MLLPRLSNLTHLDVAHTRITDDALHSIPATACLTHLNLSKCSFLTDEGIISFLNDAACHLFGLVRDDCMGRPLSERITGLDWPSLAHSETIISRDMEVFYPGLNRSLPNRALDDVLNAMYPDLNAYVSVPPLVLTKNEHGISTIQPQPQA